MPVVKFIVVAIVLALRFVGVMLCMAAMGFGFVADKLAAMVNWPGDQ